MPFEKETPKSSHFPCLFVSLFLLLRKGHVRRQQSDSQLQARKESSPEPGHAGILISDLPVSRTVRNRHLLFEPPNIWYVVMAGSVD